MNRVPSGARYTAATIATFWNRKPHTGDNPRAKPYADLYPRLTTKSDTLTAHFCV
jgi:hypothetical protein